MAATAAIAFGFLLAGTPFAGDTLFIEQRSLGPFVRATHMAVDGVGHTYVVDAGRDLLIRYDLQGKESSVGGHGWDGSSFDSPSSVATDGLNIYVSDYGNHRISRFDRRLTFISSLATRDTSFSPARFGYPLGVALSRQGDLFVLDGENLRVLKFDAQSRFERSFGARDALPGKLRNPLRIMVSRGDRVLILEPDRVLEFDYAGNFLRVHGPGVFSNATALAESRNGFVVGTPEMLYWFDSAGNPSARTNVREIVSEFPPFPVQDLAVIQETLFILTPTRATIFRIHQ